MNKVFAGVFLTLCISCNGFSKKSEKDSKPVEQDEWKTFKSDIGYEIQYPACMEVRPGYADDFEKKVETLKDVDISFVEEECKHKKNRGGVSISVYREGDNKTPIEERIIGQDKQILANIKGGRNYIYRKMDSKTSFTAILLTSSFNSVIWEVYRPCGNDLFEFRLATKANEPADPKLIEAIKKGDPSIPENIKKIIDSFKCTRE